MTITFNKVAGIYMWAVFRFFGKKQYCQDCGLTVRPTNVGAFKKLPDGSVGVWHNRLPCILALSNSDIITDKAPINQEN